MLPYTYSFLVKEKLIYPVYTWSSIIFGIICLSALVLPLRYLPAQNLSVIPLFEDETPLELVIETDLVGLLNDRRESPSYREAKLICQFEHSQALILDIRVRPRGQTRRKPGICDFPPIMLNFKNAAFTEGTLFEGHEKVKLVSHCRDETSFYQFAAREYMIYKTYNLLTDDSFRVRMVTIIYRDVQKRMAPLKRYGFLIEDDDALAARLNAKIFEDPIYSWDRCEPVSMDRMAFFEFMIGNTDWWVHTRHNVLIIQDTAGQIKPIPFDFDYAGLLNAAYAIPSPYLPIASVRDRFFKGRCLQEGGYGETIRFYRNIKDTVRQLYENSTVLDRSVKNSDWRYLESFFDLLENDDWLSAQLQNFCREDPYADYTMPVTRKKKK